MTLESIIIDIFRAPIDSTLILVLSVLYLLVQAIRIYDVRLIQIKKKGFESGVATRAEGRMLPKWVGLIHWAGWAIFIVLLILNWKYTIVLYVFIFALEVMPILENLGEFMMRPFLREAKESEPWQN